MSYLNSLFSLKRMYKRVSFLSLWRGKTDFQKTTNLCPGSKISDVRIGKYSRVGRFTSISNSEIGNFTAIGSGCNIGLGQHPTNYLTTNSIFYKKGSWGFHDDWVKKINFEESKLIIIGNDVWIGINSIIMDGVTVGDGAIIAAGSIVTKDVPPYAIVGGVPAKIIKYRFSQDIIDRVLEIKWWNFSDEKIKEILPLFHTENLTLEVLDAYFSKK